MLLCDGPHCVFSGDGEKENDSQEEMRMRSRLNCTVCDFKTTSNYVLKRHTEVHHKEAKTITCAVCEEKLQTNGEIKKIMNNLQSYTQRRRYLRQSQERNHQTELSVTYADKGSTREPLSTLI